MQLTAAQQAVVDHRSGPCRVMGGFGSGASAALRARADRLRTDGRRPLLLHHRDVVPFAVDLVSRHTGAVTLVAEVEQRRIVADAVEDVGLTGVDVAAVARSVVAFQASFLGDEELRVHADAAGQLARAEQLIAVTERYLHELGRRRLVDRGGALVQASLLLRRPELAAAERARFDELLVDDFQLATFGTNRLVSQLVGPGGPVTVAGNIEAALSEEPLASPRHLTRFDRRFGAALDVVLDDHHREPGVPTLRIVDDVAEAEAVAVDALASASGSGIPADDATVLRRATVPAAVGREWAMVVVADATEGRWPAPRPEPAWFDDELFHGPDVPDAAERDRRWREDERRRFGVATTRATRFLLVVAEVPVSPFVGALIR